MNLLQKHLKNGVKGSLAGLFAVCFIFGLSVRIGAEQSFISHCVTVVTDHYYLIYFMIPLFLLICFFVMEDDSEVVIMRYRTYFRYFIRKWASLTVISLLFMLVQTLAVAVSGIGLPLGSHWEIIDGSTSQELFNVLSVTFSSPLLCLSGVWAYMLIGLSITMLTTIWIGHFMSKSWAARTVISLYLLSVGSMRIVFIRELPITLFNHLTILHHNLTSPSRLPITAVSAAAAVLLILWTARRYWQRQFFRKKSAFKGITPYYCKELINRKNLVILGAVIAAVSLWKYLQSAGAVDSADWLVSLFLGHGTGGFWVLGFIEMLLLNCAPIYLLAVFIQRMTAEHSIFITVRLKKRREILCGVLTSGVSFILIYSAFLAIIPMIALTATGLPLDGNAVAVLGLSVFLKLLDLITQFLFVTVIYCLFGQITVSFISLIALNLLCVMPLTLVNYSPFGLSSLSRISLPQTGGWGITPPHAAGIMLITIAVFACWLFMDGYKRLPKN